jgi:hypothetical protein
VLEEIEKLSYEIDKFFDNNCSAFMTAGGVGDLLLLLAIAYDQHDPRILFLSNDDKNIFAKCFCDFFNVKCLFYKNIILSDGYDLIYKKFTSMPCFKQSAHLPDRITFPYKDWHDISKYISRIKTKTNWNKIIGKSNIVPSKYIIFAPSGGLRDVSRKRFLTQDEYNVLIEKLLELKYSIVTTGSLDDYNYYKLYKNKNCHWLTHNCLYSLNEKKDIRFLDFLQILNSSTDCISVDTYLKTLILLLQKKAKVIRSTFDGKYKNFGIDVSDQIFLNKSIWGKIKCYTFEEFIFDLNTKNKLLF